MGLSAGTTYFPLPLPLYRVGLSAGLFRYPSLFTIIWVTLHKFSSEWIRDIFYMAVHWLSPSLLSCFLVFISHISVYPPVSSPHIPFLLPSPTGVPKSLSSSLRSHFRMRLASCQMFLASFYWKWGTIYQHDVQKTQHLLSRWGKMYPHLQALLFLAGSQKGLQGPISLEHAVGLHLVFPMEDIGTGVLGND